MKKITKKYADFVSQNSAIVLVLSLVLTLIMFVGIQLMQTQDMNYEDMLPDDYDVIKAFSLISDDFGGTNSGTIVIEIDNNYVNSNEVKKVTEPILIRYSLLLETYLTNSNNVEEINGMGQIIEKQYGQIPNTQLEIETISKSFVGKSYVSEDESMLLIKITFDDEVESEEITNEISELINQIDKPAGIKISLSGEIFQDVIIKEQIGPDMNRTSMFSMIAIILILIFRSVKGVALPLMTIIFGIMWTMGFLGLTGSGLSSMTSGAISMIMGIGIDFGIQVMSRYNQELKKNDKKAAMSKTLNGILVPILTTTLACLIGFRAMGLGELSVMAEMGIIMSYGVIFCMLAAITIVPSLLVILTKDKK